ncbi:MAG TPA: hypothetical protein VNT51_00765 [Miltoncostaeaceae bacterium]|nr:hypothetical protein [Miltoncostaeaceae bacterium]
MSCSGRRVAHAGLRVDALSTMLLNCASVATSMRYMVAPVTGVQVKWGVRALSELAAVVSWAVGVVAARAGDCQSKRRGSLQVPRTPLTTGRTRHQCTPCPIGALMCSLTVGTNAVDAVVRLSSRCTPCQTCSWLLIWTW